MEEEIIEYCRERMAGFKMPRYIRFVQRFEMTGSGKIQKFLMREKVLAELDRKQK
jgi:fatty-acyl-CoA synthase